MKRIALTFIVLLAVAAVATGVTTSHWTQTTEADFKLGKFHDVVATNLGDLKLSRSVKTLLEQDPKVGAVYALAEAADGTVYAGTGPQGVVLKVKDDHVTPLLELGDGTNVSSLRVDRRGRLLIGTSGAKGQVLRLDKPGDDPAGKPGAVFQSDGVQYVWAIDEAADGTLYVATGPNGELFEVKPDGSHATLLKTDDNNLTCMTGDGGDLLYVGSDPNGRVYRVNRKTRESFVVYNAAENEIGAVAVDAKGNLYVGTAEATEQPPTPDDDAAKEKAGRPEGTGGGVPIDASPAKPPAPPTLPPEPNPGHGDPMPKMVRPAVTFLDDNPGAGDPGGGGGGGGDKPTPPKPPAAGAKVAPAPAPTQQGVNPAATGKPPAAGNAVYRVDPDGFATEVFRGPVLVLAMVEHGGTLLVATGSDGLVYQLSPAADETVVVAKVDAKQVTALLPTRDGRVLLGLSNVGGLAAMTSGYADKGTYTSQVFDAAQPSGFGNVQMHGGLPKGTAVTIATRSGNVKEPTEASWSKWSPETPAAEFVRSATPAARFFQYRLTFSTTDPAATPVVDDVDVAYLMPNLPPVVRTVKVALGSRAAQQQQQAGGDAPADASAPPPAIPPGRVQTITWEATDPNADPLVYTVSYRPVSTRDWVVLKDKVKDAFFEWDTRAVPDGRYEVRVTASDAAANPVGKGKVASRVSDPVTVDNTPPTVGDVKVTVAGTSATIAVRAVDHTTTVAGIDYAVDGSADWQATAAADGMYDGPDESTTITLSNLSAGPHTVAVRATDARGNPAIQSVAVLIEPPASGK